MKQYRPEFELTRPAPFPVYPEDGRRAWLERVRNLLVLMLVIGILVPSISRPFTPLVIPVYYDRVDLEQRTPVAINLELPKGKYEVSPAGLGYFDDNGRFIYTADVSRGLIYGRGRKGVIAIELSAPQREPVYMEERIERIRQRVEDINDIKNRLRLRRMSFEEGRNSFEEGVDELWNANAGDSGLPSVGSLGSAMAQRYAGHEMEAARVLSDRSYNIAELKQLWYESQFARLDLLVEQFDLQLGLAQLPRQQFDELVSLGDEGLVRNTMLGEIERLRTAWLERSAILDIEMGEDSRLATSLGSSVATLASPGSLTSPLLEEPKLATAPADPVLQQSLVETRTRVANAEKQMISRGLEKLDDASRHVQAGVLPSWTQVQEIAVDPVRLELPAIEELDLFARVGDSSVDPQQARDLLIELNRSFEADINRDLGEFEMSWGGERENRELTKNELAYGLLAVDSSTRSAAGPGQRRSSGVMLPQLLEDILASPQGYDVSQYELGYLRFMKWYAELDPDDDYRPLGASPRRNFGK
ncbi:MAG: hypothetical protein H7A35_03930 [Planctomycetales bacterium]|nr:hypothetical protein [bacterium]UNM09206.1 MAG: hypothetical protein H7A35_03930 [Planctomycetales bacterium]